MMNQSNYSIDDGTGHVHQNGKFIGFGIFEEPNKIHLVMDDKGKLLPNRQIIKLEKIEKV